MKHGVLVRWLWLLALAVALSAAQAAPPISRAQALRLLAHDLAPERAAGVARLADVGQMADAAPPLKRPRATGARKCLPASAVRQVCG